MKGMEKDIDKRFQSGAEMARAFRDFLKSLEVKDSAPEAPAREGGRVS